MSHTLVNTDNIFLQYFQKDISQQQYNSFNIKNTHCISEAAPITHKNINWTDITKFNTEILLNLIPYTNAKKKTKQNNKLE